MTPLPMDGRPWTLDEAIVYLRMEDLSTANKLINRWVHEGRIKCLRRGNRMLFTKDQLDAFLLLENQ